MPPCELKIQLTGCLDETRQRILELIAQRIAALSIKDIPALRCIEIEQVKAHADHDNLMAMLRYHIAEHHC
jgi:hypothetical protein